VAEAVPPDVITEGRFYIPEGAPNPEYILPDDVVLYTAQRYGLLQPNMRGIDPLVGTGTIPRVINKAGGDCIGIELDPTHHAIARRETPPGTVIRLGDCTKVYLPQYELGLHYVYTSPPFDLILHHPAEMDKIAVAFGWMLRPGGMLVIDSADEAVRHGRPIRPAAATIALLSRYGFHLQEALRFRTTSHEGGDDQFTELLFTRWW
jgi:predicted O-methyltransferase YrrM